jgi:hypothetical protein
VIGRQVVGDLNGLAVTECVDTRPADGVLQGVDLFGEPGRRRPRSRAGDGGYGQAGGLDAPEAPEAYAVSHRIASSSVV